MRSFQSVVFFLFALLACAFAQDTEVYDATVYITSTVFRVNTIYQSGTPTGPVYNSTSTISAVIPTGHANATVAPSASQVKPTPPAFTGAASALNANAFLAAFAAGVGYLVL